MSRKGSVMTMRNEATDARIQKTRQKIRLTLIELLSEKRLGEITVSELSLRAEINRKTFYRHYSDIGEVVEDLEQKMIDDLLMIAREKDVSCLNAASVLRQIGAMVELNKEHLVAVTRLNPELFTRGRLRDILRGSIRATLRRNARFESEAEFDYAVNYMLTGIMFTYTYWLRNGCREDVELVVRCAEQMTVHGCSAYLTRDWDDGQ